MGGKNDDIEGEEKCLLRADRELDRELPGGKNDGMEEGDKCGTGSVSLDNEVLSVSLELSGGKIEKIEFGLEKREICTKSVSGVMDSI